MADNDTEKRVTSGKICLPFKNIFEVKRKKKMELRANGSAMQVWKDVAVAQACSERNFYARYVINNNHLLKCIDICCVSRRQPASVLLNSLPH